MTKKELAKAIAYRRLYNSPEGRAVLADVLNHLGFFSMTPGAIHPSPDAELAMAAKAKTILYEMGIWRPENIGAIVDALLGIPIEYKTVEQEE